MDIRSINNRTQLDPTSRARKTDANLPVESTSRTSSTSAAQDTLSIGAERPSELNYAMQLLKNERKAGMQNLGEIRRNIDDGVYDQNDVQNRVSSTLERDLNYIDSSEALDAAQDVQKSEPQSMISLDEQTRARLTQNDEVLNKVTDRILQELIKF